MIFVCGGRGEGFNYRKYNTNVDDVEDEEDRHNQSPMDGRTDGRAAMKGRNRRGQRRGRSTYARRTYVRASIGWDTVEWGTVLFVYFILF